MKRTILSIFAIPLFFACAHVSQKECLEKDWQTVGMNDALAGHARADMNKIAESCSRFSMPNPPEHQYTLGYEAGLKQYCNEGRGYSHGELGKPYPSICANAKAQFPDLVKGWNDGITTYCNFDQGKYSGQRGELPNQFCTNSAHSEYYRGFASGAHAYCSDAKTGFERGKRGDSSFSHCPNELRAPFERAFQQGSKLFSEISSVKQRIKRLNEREYALNKQDRDLVSTIRDYERKIKNLDGDMEGAEKKEARLQSELRDCARHSGLCADTHIDGLERNLKIVSKNMSEFRSLSRSYSLKLPGLYSDRTRAAIELGNLKMERSNLDRELAGLNARSFRR